MAWDGYFVYDGVEIVNVERVEAYAAQAGITWFRPQFKNDSLHLVLGEDAYERADLDNAPWFDESNPYSYEFYGAYPLEVIGVSDSTQVSTTVESLSDGGVLTQPRSGTKAMVFSLVLIAASEAGAEYGNQWLKRVLSGNPCVGTGCVGGSLQYFAAEPAPVAVADFCYDRLSPLFNTPQDVQDRLARTLRRVQTTVGLTTTSKRATTDSAAVWTVQFTMTASNPFEFSNEVSLVERMVPTRINPVPNPSFEVNTGYWFAGNCTLTRTTAQKVYGTYSGALTASTNSTYYYIDGGGGASPTAPGAVWSAGCWVRAPRAMTVQPAIQARTAGGTYITNLATDVAVPANEWTWVEAIGKVMPATTGLASILLIIPATGVVAGEVTYVDGFLLEQSPALGPYFDGDTTGPEDVWSWTGAPHASPSVQSPALSVNLAQSPKRLGPTDMSLLFWLNRVDEGVEGKFTATSTAAQGYSSTYLPAAAGEKVTMGVNFRTNGAIAGAATPVLAVNWLDSGYSVIASSQAPLSKNQPVSTRYTLTAEAPANTVYYQFYPYYSPNGLSTDQFWMKNLTVVKTPVGADPYDGTFFDGDTTDGMNGVYSWLGTPDASRSMKTGYDPAYTGTGVLTPYPVTDEEECFGEGFQPVYDPLFPQPVAPPPPPGITWGNSIPPLDWERIRFTIPATYVPQWGRAVPIITLSAPMAEARNIRIRIYPDLPELGNINALDPCGFVADFVVSYMPPESVLVIDSASKAVYLDTDAGRRRADSLVLGSGGGLFQWPELSCGMQHVVTVDAPVGQTGSSPITALTLVGKSA